MILTITMVLVLFASCDSNKQQEMANRESDVRSATQSDGSDNNKNTEKLDREYLEKTVGLVEFPHGKELMFSNVELGSESSVSASLVNSSKFPLRLDSFSFTESDSQFSLDGVPQNSLGLPESERLLCNAIVAPKSDCLIRIKLSAKKIGPLFAKLKMKYSVPEFPFSWETSLEVKATVNGSGILDIASQAPTLPPVEIGDHRDFTISIINTGKLPVIPAFSESSSPSGFAIQTNQCPSKIEPRQLCDITVRFQPLRQGQHGGPFSIVYSDESVGRKTTTIELTGFGILSGNLVASIGQFDFGQVVAGGEDHKVVTIRNDGDLPVPLSTAVLGQTSSAFSWAIFPAKGGTCPEFLMPNESCFGKLLFNPTEKKTEEGSASIAYHSGIKSDVVSISLRGEGINPGILTSLSGESADFGQVTIGKRKTNELELKNTGDQELGFSSFDLPAGAAFAVSNPDPMEASACRQNLPANASCKITVTFEPKSIADTSAQLIVNFSTLLKPSNAIEVRLDGAPRTPGSLDSAPIVLNDILKDPSPTSVALVFRLSNTGQSQISNIGPAGDSSLNAPFSYRGLNSFPGGWSDACGSSVLLDPGRSCYVPVIFTPPGVVGEYRVEIPVKYFDGVREQVVTLQGLAKTVDIAILKTEFSTLSVGPGVIGTNLSVKINIYNVGSREASEVKGLADANGHFKFTGDKYPGTNGTCGLNIPPKTVCQVEAVYDFFTYIDEYSELNFTYFNGTTTKDLSQYVYARGLLPGKLQINGGASAVSFADAVPGRRRNVTLTISNAGGIAIAMDQLDVSQLSSKMQLVPGSDRCSQINLAGGKSCTVDFRFASEVSGIFEGSVKVRGVDTAHFKTSADVTLRGKGISCGDSPYGRDGRSEIIKDNWGNFLTSPRAVFLNSDKSIFIVGAGNNVPMNNRWTYPIIFTKLLCDGEVDDSFRVNGRSYREIVPITFNFAPHHFNRGNSDEFIAVGPADQDAFDAKRSSPGIVLFDVAGNIKWSSKSRGSVTKNLINGLFRPQVVGDQIIAISETPPPYSYLPPSSVYLKYPYLGTEPSEFIGTLPPLDVTWEAIQPDGKIIKIGEEAWGLRTIRYKADGSIDAP